MKAINFTDDEIKFIDMALRSVQVHITRTIDRYDGTQGFSKSVDELITTESARNQMAESIRKKLNKYK